MELLTHVLPDKLYQAESELEVNLGQLHLHTLCYKQINARQQHPMTWCFREMAINEKL